MNNTSESLIKNFKGTILINGTFFICRNEQLSKTKTHRVPAKLPNWRLNSFSVMKLTVLL